MALRRKVQPIGSRSAVAAFAAVVLGPVFLTGAVSARMPAAVFMHAVSAVSTWGRAIEVRGLTAGTYLRSVSCSVPDNCSGVGDYGTVPGHPHPFVVSEVNGIWRKAQQVPGITVLDSGGAAQLFSVSCASPGNCSAGGTYSNSAGSGLQVFVVSEVNGIWRKAQQLPGIRALNAGRDSGLADVSCGSAGNCSTGGFYTDSSGNHQAFVASQVNGRWHDGIQIPGTPALSGGGSVNFGSVSCATAGNCSAGGSYQSGRAQQAFVVSEVNGTWGAAQEIPGIAALNTGGTAYVSSVSCPSPGNCGAGGAYETSIGAGNFQAFVVSQVNGVWGAAEQVAGTTSLNGNPGAAVSSVSCASAGNCSAGGVYTPSTPQPFVVTEVNGTWRTAQQVPGMTALNTGGDAQISSVSCGSAGNCGAGGSYTDSSGNSQAFVVSQVHGAWQSALEVPGIAALDAGGGAGFSSVSCPAAGNCSASGSFTNRSGTGQAFVVGYQVKPTVTRLSPTSGPAPGGNVVTIRGSRLIDVIRVWFGARRGTHVRVISAHELKVTAPAGTGTVNVVVTNPGGPSAFTGQDLYQYIPRPAISGLTPETGPSRGGTIVTIRGSHLTHVTKIRFGAKRGTHVRMISAHELKVTAPAGTGTVNVTVTTPGGTSARSRNDRYRYR